MKKEYKWILIVIGIIIVLGGVLVLFRGDEDTWIRDSNGNWVRHGNPSQTLDEFLSHQK